MSRRRVLILAHFFPPLAGGGVHRVLSFVEHLPAHGWDCTVVCAGEHDYWVRDVSLLARVPEATEVLRVRGASALAQWLRLRRGADAGRRSGATFAGLRRLADWWLVPDPYVGWSRRAGRVTRERLGRGDIDEAVKNGEITEAFQRYHELAERMADYPILDESDYSERELNATYENVGEAAWRLKGEFNLPEDWQSDVYHWLSDHRDHALENTDDQGGWPGEDDLEAAFEALGYQRAA